MANLTNHEKSAIIGYWRMGVKDEVIAELIGCSVMEACATILSYQYILQQKRKTKQT